MLDLQHPSDFIIDRTAQLCASSRTPARGLQLALTDKSRESTQLATGVANLQETARVTSASGACIEGIA